MKETREIIDLLDNWEGLLYEHNTSELDDLLSCLEDFTAKVKRRKRQEEKYL